MIATSKIISPVSLPVILYIEHKLRCLNNTYSLIKYPYTRWYFILLLSGWWIKEA
jgi:hypothetical protein